MGERPRRHAIRFRRRTHEPRTRHRPPHVVRCWEIPADAVPESFVDADGVGAVRCDRPITIDLSGLKLSEALDRLTTADPRYYWKHVAGTSMINIIPYKSKLEFEVG